MANILARLSTHPAGAQALPLSLLNTIACIFLVIFACALPISTTATGVCLYGVIFCWLFDKNLSQRIAFYLNYPLTKPIFAIIGLSLIGIFYSAANWHDASKSFYHMARLSFIPIIAYYCQDEKNPIKNLILIAFVGAMICTIFCTFLKVYGHIPIGKRTYGHDVFKDHIIISYFMAMSVYLLWIWLQEQKAAQPFIFALLSLFGYYFIFLNTGKIGIVMLGITFGYYAWRKYRIKGVRNACGLFMLFIMVSYCLSPTFQIRFDQLILEIQQDISNTGSTPLSYESSFGRRSEFAINSIMLFFERPIIGHGTGSFQMVYSNYFTNQYQVMSSNPHNQYLFILVESGLIGLTMLAWLFTSQWRMLSHLKKNQNVLAKGILLAFIIGCAFNSWLIDFSELHFYLLISGYYITANVKNDNKSTYRVS